jgi:drug/metabolite transporter (DMT)-like permease
MRVPNTVGWGLRLAFATALISGLSIFLNGRFVSLFDDPTLLAATRNGLVGLILVGVAIASGGLGVLARLGWRERAGLLVVGIVGGGISFALFFNGLAASSSPAAAIIHKTLFVWVAALAIPFLGERVGAVQVAALGLLLAGTLVLAPAGSIGPGVGEAMVVAAKRLLRGGVPVSLVAAARMVVGSATLFLVVGTTGDASAILAFGAEQWLAIAITTALLVGYVLTWFGALKRAPATSVTSILVLGAVVTTLLQSWATGGLPAPSAVAGNLLLIAGGVVAVVAARLAGGPIRPAAPALAGNG